MLDLLGPKTEKDLEKPVKQKVRSGSRLSRTVEKQPDGICAQQRPRSAWALTQSGQNRHFPHKKSFNRSISSKCMAMTDQTGWMLRLI